MQSDITNTGLISLLSNLFTFIAPPTILSIPEAHANCLLGVSANLLSWVARGVAYLFSSLASALSSLLVLLGMHVDSLLPRSVGLRDRSLHKTVLF